MLQGFSITCIVEKLCVYAASWRVVVLEDGVRCDEEGVGCYGEGEVIWAVGAFVM